MLNIRVCLIHENYGDIWSEYNEYNIVYLLGVVLMIRTYLLQYWDNYMVLPRSIGMNASYGQHSMWTETACDVNPEVSYL